MERNGIPLGGGYLECSACAGKQQPSNPISEKERKAGSNEGRESFGDQKDLVE